MNIVERTNKENNKHALSITINKPREVQRQAMVLLMLHRRHDLPNKFHCVEKRLD